MTLTNMYREKDICQNMRVLIVNCRDINCSCQIAVSIGLTLKKYIVHFGCIFRFNDIVKSSVSFWPKIAKKRFSVISMGLTFTERM
ncbi:hypothetical protein WN48_07304 [Eufriesea mexicana]|uniref:Uncharacterized protein n=1 Tax=Eufriesea mexicana TaxID=516756 RepID=A0A310SVK0_9HYME|nr:hypothetical protein WN48_07304 [Eufriesea mexicana]